jgi:hypothetical protein
MSESIDRRMELGYGIKEIFYEHTCGVVDEREAKMLAHQILAEIRKSNAPEWVAEELEKKLECCECYRALQRSRSALL